MGTITIPKFEVEAAPESRLAPFDITVDPSKVREFDQKKFDDWFSDMHKRSKMHYGYDYETAYIAGIEPDEEGNWPEWLKRPGTPSLTGTWSDETSEKKKSKVVIPKFGESVESGVTDYAGARERGEDTLMPSPEEIRKKYEATIKGMEDTKQEIIKAGDFTPELVEKYNTLLAQAKDYEAVYEPEKGRSVMQYLGDAISPGFTERGLEEGARRRAQKEEFRRYREEHGEAHPDEKHKSVRVAKQFVTGALNQALLGLPEAYWQATGEHDEPEGTAEKVAHGFGSAVGFIIGGPGKVAASIGSRILTKAAVHAGSKFGKRVAINLAREIPALTGASLAASTGEMLTSTGIDEALDTLFSATVGGAAMGAAFGATRGIIPGAGAKEFIKRYGLGVTLLDLVRGERPWDDRELGEKVFGYTLDAAFLLHGMPRNRSLQLQLLKSDQKIADLISNKEIREAWKNGTAAEREALLRRFNRLGAESEEVATRAEEVVPRPELPGSRDVLYPGETPTGKWYEQGEQGMIPSKEHPVRRAVEEALATELPKLPAADRVYGEGFTARDVRPVDMQQGAVEPEIVRPGAEPEVVRPLPSHSEAGPTEVQARSKIDRPSAKTTREAEISLLKNIKAAGEAGLRERGSISVDLAQKSKGYTKVLLKNSLEDGSVSSGSPVRLTTVDELRAVLKSGSLVVGKDAEGHSVISAQPLRRHLPIVGYGANNKVSAAIVFKPEHVEGKGGQPNEIIIDPKTKLEDLKFAVSGQTKLLNIQELRSLVSSTKPEVKPEVKVEPKTKLIAEDKGLHKLAKSLNATYDGKMGLPGKEVNLFTDKVTKATFAFKEGENISVELPKKRKAFLADAVKANEDNPKAARPHVRKLGRQVYKEGATQWQHWSGEIRKLVGKSFVKLKDLMRKEWERLKVEVKKPAGGSKLMSFGGALDPIDVLRTTYKTYKGVQKGMDIISRQLKNLTSPIVNYPGSKISLLRTKHGENMFYLLGGYDRVIEPFAGTGIVSRTAQRIFGAQGLQNDINPEFSVLDRAVRQHPENIKSELSKYYDQLLAIKKTYPSGGRKAYDAVRQVYDNVVKGNAVKNLPDEIGQGVQLIAKYGTLSRVGGPGFTSGQLLIFGPHSKEPYRWSKRSVKASKDRTFRAIDEHIEGTKYNAAYGYSSYDNIPDLVKAVSKDSVGRDVYFVDPPYPVRTKSGRGVLYKTESVDYTRMENALKLIDDLNAVYKSGNDIIYTNHPIPELIKKLNSSGFTVEVVKLGVSSKRQEMVATKIHNLDAVLKRTARTLGKRAEEIESADKLFTQLSLLKDVEVVDTLTQLRKSISSQKGETRIIPDIARMVYNLGAKVYSAGQRVHSTWQKEMRGLLGDLWGKLKHVASVAWKTINNQSGAIKNPFYREDPTIKPLGRLERVKEVGEIFGELWSDSKVSVEKARQTLAGMRRPKPPIPDIGGVEYVPGADARYEDQRVIRKSERTRLIQESGKLRQFLDKIQADIEKFSSPSGEATYNKEIERRVARLEKDITRLMKAGSKQKASRLKKAVEQLNQRSVTRHIGNLKRIQTKLTEAVAAKEAQMAATPDVQDILSAKIERVKVKFLKQMPDMNYAILGRFLENPIYTFEAWGRKVKGGTSAVKEMFVYPLRSAETKAVKQFMVIREKADALKASLPRSSGKRIITYAISQEKGGAAVLKNEGITEIPKLTEKEMEVYNWMRKGFDVFHGLVNKRRLEAGMEPMGFIENYFTFSRELTLADALGFGFMDSAMNKYLHPKGTAFPHALKRKGGIEKIQLDAFNVFNSYMQLATKHMYLSPEIARMREYARTIEFSHPNTYKMLTDYLDFKAGIKHSTLPPGLDNIFRIISDNVTTATLVSNVRSAFVQPAAITNAYAALGEKYTALGISGLFAKVPGTEMTWYEFAREESNHLLNRSFDASYDAIRTGMVGKVARARAKFVKSWAGVRPLQELDALTASATWIGAYRKAVEFEGMRFGSKEARNYADDITIKTQASAAKEDLAPIQRTALGKFFTTFQTFVINNWNFVKREMAGIGNTDVSKPEVARNMARYMFGLMLAGIFYEDVLGVNAPDPTPFHAARDVVERGGTAGEATMAGILEALQILPGISGIRYGTTMLGASAQFLSDTGSALYSSSGGHIARRIPWYELAGKALGIPGTVQASKFIKIREKGGSVVESIIGAYPETAKDKKRAFRKIYKRAIENKDYDKARELRQDVINWNRKKAAEGKYDERIDID